MLTFYTLRMRELYRLVFRFLPEDEPLFYEPEELEPSGPGLGVVLWPLAIACVLAIVIVGVKEWRRRRLCNPRKDHYRPGRR